MVTWSHSCGGSKRSRLGPIFMRFLCCADVGAVLLGGVLGYGVEPAAGTRMADTVVIEKTAAELEAAMTNQVNALIQEQPAGNASAEKYHVNIPLASGVIVLTIIGFRLMASRFAGRLAGKLDPWAPVR